MDTRNNNLINKAARRKKILDEEKRMKYENSLRIQETRAQKAAERRKEVIQKVKEKCQIQNQKVQAIAEKRKVQMEEKRNQSPEQDGTVEQIQYKFPSYEEFRASVCRQIFSLPESIIFYMAKNTPSREIHQKLIQSCKFFFLKNPVIYLHCLRYNDADGWKTCVNESCIFLVGEECHKIELDMDKIQSKIQVAGLLKISSSTLKFATSVIPKLYNGDIEYLCLEKQDISFNELLFFSQNLKYFYLIESTVLENGSEVPCEILLTNLPKLSVFYYCARPNAVADNSNMAQELLKIPDFKKMRFFHYNGLSESFDIDTFFQYLKDNRRTKVSLWYKGPLSDEYKEKLQAITDEILDAELPRPYKTPLIQFDGQTRALELFVKHVFV